MVGLFARVAAVLALAAWGGCDDPGMPGTTPELCVAGFIEVPTREAAWTEGTTTVGIRGTVHRTECSEEETIQVTVSNEATGFFETQIATTECVQTFPTTGATQRNYEYYEFVPLRRGANRIEVRAMSSCDSLNVTCDPCVDPAPLPDAGPPPADAAPPDGPAPCEFAVLDPTASESTTTDNPAGVSGTIGSTGEHVYWQNNTLGDWAEIPYTAGEMTWSGQVPLVAGERNDVILSAECSGGGHAAEARFITQVPP